LRIVIHDVGNRFDSQTHADAERRVLLTLASIADVVQHVVVRLGRVEYSAIEAANHCIASVSVYLRSGGQVNLASHGQHPSDAIDRVTGRMAAAMETYVKATESTASGP